MAVGLFFSALTENQIVAAILTFLTLLLFLILNWLSQIGSGAWQGVVGYLSFSQHFEDMAKGILDTQGRRLLPEPVVLRPLPGPFGPRSRGGGGDPMDKLKKNLNLVAAGLIFAALAVATVWPYRNTVILVLGAAGPGRARGPRRPQPGGAQAVVHPKVLPLLGQPSAHRRPRPGHPGPGQLLRLEARLPEGLHGGQAPQPVRPVGRRARGPQGRGVLQGLLPRGQLRPGGHGEPAQALRLPLFSGPLRVHRSGQEPRAGQALRRHPGRDHDHRSRRQGRPYHDDLGRGPDQRPDQGHPGPEEGRLLPRRARRGVRRRDGRQRLLHGQGRAGEDSATRSRSRAWPWPTGSPRTAPCSSSPDRRRTSCRTSTRRSGPTSRAAAGPCSWSTPRRRPSCRSSSPITASSSRTTSSSTPSRGCSAAITSCPSSANTSRTPSRPSSATPRSSPTPVPSRSARPSPRGPRSRRWPRPARTPGRSASSTRRRSSSRRRRTSRDRSASRPSPRSRPSSTLPLRPRPSRASRRPPKRPIRRPGVAVVGDSDFVKNRYYGLSGNGNFFLNVANWLAEEADLIAIQPKTQSPRTLQMTPSQGRLLMLVSLVLLPLAILVAGVTVWLRRRSL
ncbi:MAG: hypothetical protein MZU95_02050 [Desulfomicrobium escambiense]|nr:hypothetical protein [Desulfomicrobium escambiense]